MTDLDKRIDEIWDAVKPATQLGVKTSFADYDWFKQAIKNEVEKAYMRGIDDEYDCFKAGGHDNEPTAHTSYSTKWGKTKSLERGE
jgi:hypothetical protein